MNLGLDGKVVLIAGSPDGAAAFVAALKREGARTAVCADGGQEPMEGADAVYRRDFSSFSSAEALRDEILRRFGRLDGLVFLADTPPGAELIKTETDSLRRSLGTAREAFVCCKVFAGAMGTLGGGALVYVTTLHDEKPNGGDAAHSMAQGMIQNLVTEAAVEYGERNVRVNQITMGARASSAERFRSGISSFYEGARYKVPVGRLGAPADPAELAAFLLGDLAGYISGARIRVDGGLSLHYLDFKANYRAHAAPEGGQP